MKKTTQLAVCALLVSTMSVSCTGLFDADTIHSSDLGRAGTTYSAVVVDAQAITIAASTTAKTASAAAGALAGGAAASMLGGGSGKTMATAGGAIVGGLLGMGAANQLGKQKAQRITLQVEGRKGLVTLNQEVTKQFGYLSAGQQGTYTEVPGGKSYFRPY